MIQRRLQAITTAAVAVVMTLTIAGCSDDDNLFTASVISWEITDACDDQQGLVVRFFDETTGTVFPSSTTVFDVFEDESFTFVIDCQRDHVICFGAVTDPTPSTSFGQGIDGSLACSNCCLVCGNDPFGENTLTC